MLKRVTNITNKSKVTTLPACLLLQNIISQYTTSTTNLYLYSAQLYISIRSTRRKSQKQRRKASSAVGSAKCRDSISIIDISTRTTLNTSINTDNRTSSFTVVRLPRLDIRIHKSEASSLEQELLQQGSTPLIDVALSTRNAYLTIEPKNYIMRQKAKKSNNQRNTNAVSVTYKEVNKSISSNIDIFSPKPTLSIEALNIQ